MDLEALGLEFELDLEVLNWLGFDLELGLVFELVFELDFEALGLAFELDFEVLELVFELEF